MDSKAKQDATGCDGLHRLIYLQITYFKRILQKELADWVHRDARTIKPREVIEALGRDCRPPCSGDGQSRGRIAVAIVPVRHPPADSRILAGAAAFRPGGTERPRQRALDEEELGALLANVDEVTKRAKRTGVAIRLVLPTAVRRSELTGARWSELDLEAKSPVWGIPGERTKTGVSFAVPLTPPAVEQFKRLKRLAGRSPWLFPAEDGDGPVDPKLLTRSIARHLDTDCFNNRGRLFW